MPRNLRFTFRGPVRTYQRHRDAIENSVTAAALTLLVGVFLDGVGAYPDQWRTVLLLAIFALGAQARAWGYYAAIATLAWPLWLLSPYLAALFLAVALLPRLWIIEHLPWAVLVAAAPFLAEWQVLGLVPLLAGLLGGPIVGLWAGGLAALWLKLAAGLAGWQAELGALHGIGFTLAAIEPRVAGASSLETLELLAAPFAQSSTFLLLHVLQVVAWGGAGWLVGQIRELDWAHEEPRFALAPALAAGALLLWAALYLLPAWLELDSIATFLTRPRPAAGLALAALTAALWAATYEQLQRPLPRRTVRPRVERMSGEAAPVAEGGAPSAKRPRADVPPADEDDVIMLELD